MIGIHTPRTSPDTLVDITAAPRRWRPSSCTRRRARTACACQPARLARCRAGTRRSSSSTAKTLPSPAPAADRAPTTCRRHGQSNPNIEMTPLLLVMATCLGLAPTSGETRGPFRHLQQNNLRDGARQERSTRRHSRPARGWARDVPNRSDQQDAAGVAPTGRTGQRSGAAMASRPPDGRSARGRSPRRPDYLRRR